VNSAWSLVLLVFKTWLSFRMASKYIKVKNKMVFMEELLNKAKQRISNA